MAGKTTTTLKSKSKTISRTKTTLSATSKWPAQTISVRLLSILISMVSRSMQLLRELHSHHKDVRMLGLVALAISLSLRLSGKAHSSLWNKRQVCCHQADRHGTHQWLSICGKEAQVRGSSYVADGTTKISWWAQHSQWIAIESSIRGTRSIFKGSRRSTRLRKVCDRIETTWPLSWRSAWYSTSSIRCKSWV